MLRIFLLASCLLGSIYGGIEAVNLTANHIVSNSVEALDGLNSIDKEFQEALDEVAGTREIGLEMLRNKQAIIAQFEQKCPLFLINECQSCSLTRFQTPQLRDRFESRVVSQVIEKLAHNEIVHYASFGSGSLFQDLVILTKILNQKSNAHLVVHCIDNKYRSAALYQEIAQETRQILPHDSEDIKVLMQKFKQGLSTKKNYPDLPDEGLEEFVLYIIQEGRLFHQLNAFMKQNFADARIEIHIHPSVRVYCEYLAKHTMQYPDVLVAADIEDPENGGLGAEDYCELCIRTLQNNPSSKNLWLSKYYGDSDAQICTVSLDHKNASKSEEVTIDGKTFEAFIHAEDIITS